MEQSTRCSWEPSSHREYRHGVYRWSLFDTQPSDHEFCSCPEPSGGSAHRRIDLGFSNACFATHLSGKRVMDCGLLRTDLWAQFATALDRLAFPAGTGSQKFWPSMSVSRAQSKMGTSRTRSVLKKSSHWGRLSSLPGDTALNDEKVNCRRYLCP
jgi:hypothetical protein